VGCVMMDKGRGETVSGPAVGSEVFVGVCESSEVTWDGRRDSNGSRVGRDGWTGRETTLGGPRLRIAAGWCLKKASRAGREVN
jgi:hypothetical protein